MTKKQLSILTSAIFLILGVLISWEPQLFGVKPQTSQQADLITSPSPESTQTASSSAVLGGNYEDGMVTRVIDGDTIVVNLNGQNKTVRLVGMDTPETVDPRRPVGCFGKEASDETKSLLTNKEVLLQKDVSETDKYGRLLRYVYLKLDNGQTLFVDDYLVREGYAKVLTIPPDVKYADQFVEAQRQATLQKKGLWSKCM